MLSEVNTGEERLATLNLHRRYLAGALARDNENTRLADEFRRTEELLTSTKAIMAAPKNRWVEVKKSRVVEVGSVGKVVYVTPEKNAVRVEFGNSERVSCSLSNVRVIDWEPLPAFVPWVGERVRNFINGEELVVVEWCLSHVRVQPPGINQDTYRLDREYVTRLHPDF